MASTQALSAAAQDRKARLAQLKSLKRKQPNEPALEQQHQPASTLTPTAAAGEEEQEDSPANPTSKHLSLRNYDPQTRTAKLGFETAPSSGTPTLESQAAALAAEAKSQAAREEEEKAQKPLDLFNLQPRKPNWDLKRDLESKMRVLDVRTDNAVAKLVRERIAGQRSKAEAGGGIAGGRGDGGDEAAGIEGSTLVEAANVREREDLAEARREREEEAALLDGGI